MKRRLWMAAACLAVTPAFASAPLTAPLTAPVAAPPTEADWPMVPATPKRTAAAPELPPEAAPAPADAAAQTAPLKPEQKYFTITLDGPRAGTPPTEAPAADDEAWVDEEELLPTPLPANLLLNRIRGAFSLPESADPAVRKELEWYAKRPGYLQRVFSRAERYLHHIVTEVEARGLPMELALLPVVESGFNPYAYSPGRAAGLWQFIPASGARMGLKQNWWQDQRRDVVASTTAALSYLQTLNALFAGDWFLTIAAYNMGDGAVLRAIEKNRREGKPTDFWSLTLPAETRAYVPRLLALRTVLLDPERYGHRLPPIADAPYFRRVETGGQFDLRLAAEHAKVTPEELHALNPAFHRWATDPQGPHVLYVPVPVADAFAALVPSLTAAQRLSLAMHRVVPGETTAAVARRYRTPLEAVRAMNPGLPLRPTAGTVLRVPVEPGHPLRSGLVIEGDLAAIGGATGTPATAGSGGAASTAAPDGLGNAAPDRPVAKPRHVVYRVKSGDTLYSIAKRFKVRIEDLKRWNRLRSNTLKPGQRLEVELRAPR